MAGSTSLSGQARPRPTATSQITRSTWQIRGTDTIEQEKNFLLASQTGRLLLHIDEALRRLYRSPETFGRCESCGQVIAYERLDALPYARTCAACKKREENATPVVADGPATT